MGLRDLDLSISYGPHDDGLRNFFIPAMSASVRYDRAAGYFSSTMLAVAATGVTRLILNGGKMRLLCGADLSEADAEAIREGHARLEERVTSRMKIRLVLPEGDFTENRLKALAWLVGTGQLEIKVVLPTDEEGIPLPASKAESYYHPKEGLFVDARGDAVGFSGSVNESATALEENYESFMVFNSWETSAHLSQIRHRFERLWTGKERDWIAISVPEAVTRELLKLRPTRPPVREFGVDPPEEEESGQAVVELDADERERIVFQFLRDVPHLLSAGQLGMATCTVRPWPHQTRVADSIVKGFPERFLLCDEVGLGKTIEAGLAIRQLVLSGVACRALILVPKSVLVQWQEELYEKFVLNIPRYDGDRFFDVFGREALGNGHENPWNAHPVMLASSHLAKRRARQPQLLDSDDWDLVVVDEAHHARRKDFLNRDQFRPNRLLELLMGSHGQRGLADKTRGLLLLTATPMQVDPVEVFDLLKLLDVGGRWGVEGNFLDYFSELRRPFEEVNWRFVLSMLSDYVDAGGQWDRRFCEVAEERLGPAVWDQLRALHRSQNPESIIARLDAQGQAFLREMAVRHTPLRQRIFRNTRSLLKEYHRWGLLTERIPDRDPRPEWIDMRPDEWCLYERIEDYIRNHYQKYEAERKGLGFIMTVYRRRLTSSFAAIERSLERRLRYLVGDTEDIGLTDDDLDQDDLDADVAEVLALDEDEPEAEAVPRLFRDEADYVRDFLAELRALGTDSKFEQLSGDLTEFLRRRDSVIVFTQYTDTMDYLRDRLRHVYGGQVACYSGRGGEKWDGEAWVRTTKEEIKTAFRESQTVKILLCTESASEGLNLQTCGVLINYEMPWNPMRVEQRIGRIDRIGQVHDRVWIRNYFYQGTVEATVYQRLDDRITSFESIIGELQPILSRVARVIEAAAMANDLQRGELIAQEVEEINRQVRSAEVSELDLDKFAVETVEAAAKEPPPVTLQELERTIVSCPMFAERLEPHPQIAGAHRLDWNGAWQAITFNPALFDEHPNTLRLLTYGEATLEEMLAAVQPPTAHAAPGRVLRCVVDKPWPLIGYYQCRKGDPIQRLSVLFDALNEQESSGADRMEAIRASFSEAVREVLAKEAERVAARTRASESSLREEIRQLLQEAAYLHLSLAAQSGLFDEPSPLDFTEQAYGRLTRYGVPFAGALRVVGDGLPPLRPDDPRYLRLGSFSKILLERRLEGLRGRLLDRLQQLMKRSQIQTSDLADNGYEAEMPFLQRF